MADKVYTLYRENKGKELSKTWIQDVFDEMMKSESDLIPFIMDFTPIDKTGGDLGTYLYDDFAIKINREEIRKQIPSNPHLLALEVIRHEMEHARNLRNLYEGKQDIESLVIRYALKWYAMKHQIDRDYNIDDLEPDYLLMSTKLQYGINPEERLVRIKAWKYVVNLIKNSRDIESLTIARNNLLKSYVRGYKDNRYYMDAPTMLFLMRTGMHHYHYWLKNQIDKKNYSFDTRLTYGLPITYREYNKGILQKVKLKKRDEER